MNPELLNFFNIAKEVTKDIAIYIAPIAALIVSIIALIKSNKTAKVSLQLSEVEEKLQKCELTIKEFELKKIQEQEEKKAFVEARVIKLSTGKYRLRISNIGSATAYNVDISIPHEYNVILMKNKVPFEYLEPGNSFDETVLFHSGSCPKFKVTTTWENENGEEETNEQIRDW